MLTDSLKTLVYISPNPMTRAALLRCTYSIGILLRAMPWCMIFTVCVCP